MAVAALEVPRCEVQAPGSGGSYIADFACFYPRVIVECDGGQHADSRYDDRRDAWFRSLGFRTFRFWNNEIIEEAEGVADALAKALGG